MSENTQDTTKDSSRITLTKRKALGGLTVAGLASAGAGAGTFALFSDTEEVDGNTVTAGTLDLTVQGGSQSTALEVQNAAPGQSGAGQVTVNNQGSLDGYLNFQVGTASDGENGVVEPEDGSTGENGGQPGELSKWLQLRIGYDENQNGDLGPNEGAIDGYVKSSDGAGFPGVGGMQRVKANPNAPIPAGQSRDLIVEWSIPSGAGNLIQSDTMTLDLTGELLQEPAPADIVLNGQTAYGQGAGFAYPWDTTTSQSKIGTGAWGTSDHSGSNNSYKQGYYFGGDFSSSDALPEYTVSEIAEISYHLYEDSPLAGNDIYLGIYTRAEGDGGDAASWYDSRLQALPIESNNGSPNFTPGEWNKFSTASGATNTLTWSDTGRGGNFNQPLPELDDIGSATPLDWSNYGANLSTTHDYTDETVMALSLQVNSTSPELVAWIDDVYVELNSGESVRYDLEP